LPKEANSGAPSGYKARKQKDYTFILTPQDYLSKISDTPMQKTPLSMVISAYSSGGQGKLFRARFSA